MTQRSRDDDQFAFLKKPISQQEKDIEEDWRRREEQIDREWYAADEETNMLYDVENHQNDLFGSYAAQEVEEKEAAMKHVVD